MIRRLAAAAVAAAAAAALAPLAAAVPAFAHGAPTTPISRTAACAAGGGTATGTAACQAALKANGGPFGTFDNLRVPDVNGNDKKFVPDGELCSGGLDKFKGLDIARDDFPSTPVSAGQSLKIKYRATLPHAGSFRIYLTKQGFDPAKKLSWDDLGNKVAEIKDPPLDDGSYGMSVKLPSDRTGRHILYIVWQTSSTADTYYSCSDVVFKTVAAVAPKPAKTTVKAAAKPVIKATTSKTPDITETSEPVAIAAPTAPATPEITTVGQESQVTLGHQILLGAAIVGAGALLWAVVGAFLRRRRENL
jgi:predicted carbohydrate-binding protein with CBM5 and CBM33 domain